MKALFRIPTKILAYISTLIYFKPKYIYEDKKQQSRFFRGKAIIASNHKKGIDFVFLKHVFVFRYLRCIVAETIYDANVVLKTFLNLLGSIRINRHLHDMSFLQKSLKVLDKNGVIEIYPEGKLPEDDKLQSFTYSTVYLAMLSGAKVIPVYHDGNYGLFKRVRIVIGKPLYFKSDDVNPSVEDLKANTQKLENKVLKLKKLIKE